MAHEEPASRKPIEPPDPTYLDLCWDGPQDPDNPKNWSLKTRVANALIITSISLLSSFSSSILAPAVPDIMGQFGVTDKIIGTLTTSLYVLGLGFGPFVLAPLSELYGRWVVYSSTLTLFSLFQIGCALSNSMTSLIVLRFLAGLTGGVAPSLGQASMSDLWDAQDRGRWAAVLSIGPMLGPPVGNLFASLILSRKPWNWIFWILLILSGVLVPLTVFVLQESYESVILRKRQHRRLRHHSITANYAEEKPVKDNDNGICLAPNPWNFLGHAISRPLRFMATSPILIAVGFFLAYTYGMLYLFLTSMPLLFAKEQRQSGLFNYQFNKVGTGLSYLGLAVGILLGCLAQVHGQTQIWIFLTRRNGEGRPEYRLLPMTAGMLFIPIALFWYGWSAELQDHWIVPQIATGLLAFGMFITFQSTQGPLRFLSACLASHILFQAVYLTEAFIPYSASAMAAATLMRSITGAVFPLFGQQLFIHLGFGKGGTLLGMLALPAVPLPWILYKHGKYLRERWAIVG